MKDADESLVYYGAITWKVSGFQSIASADLTVYGNDAPTMLVSSDASKIQTAACSNVHTCFGSKLLYSEKIEEVFLHSNGSFESGTRFIVLGKDV